MAPTPTRAPAPTLAVPWALDATTVVLLAEQVCAESAAERCAVVDGGTRHCICRTTPNICCGGELTVGTAEYIWTRHGFRHEEASGLTLI